MSTKIEGGSTATVKYEVYKKKCIDLLNKLIEPCPKVKEQSHDIERDKGPQGQDPQGQGQGQGPIDEPGDQGQGPDKSSTVLKHNGQVGSLAELIVFLIKSPIKDDLIRMKLNDVYNIFNPTARGIVSKQPT
jgi:hypothetical protein